MKWLWARIARLGGWSFVGELPDVPKMVVAVYPHTTNWDFPLFLGALGSYGVDVRFLAARGLFKGPFGRFLRRIGGIPVDQDGTGSVVDAAVAEFERRERMILVVTPEGTRGPSPWRSGFWRIADRVDVPVVMAYVDGDARVVGMGPAMRIDGDPHRWMEVAAEFYADKPGLKPHRRGPVRLADDHEPGSR